MEFSSVPSSSSRKGRRRNLEKIWGRRRDKRESEKRRWMQGKEKERRRGLKGKRKLELEKAKN